MTLGCNHITIPINGARNPRPPTPKPNPCQPHKPHPRDDAAAPTLTRWIGGESYDFVLTDLLNAHLPNWLAERPALLSTEAIPLGKSRKEEHQERASEGHGCGGGASAEWLRRREWRRQPERSEPDDRCPRRRGARA